jgi:hypothetical protein
MREASQGTISNTELMLSANRAMMLGVADSAEEMATLMEIAGARGKAMGLSTAQAFSDLVTGLGRQSAMILDNLGITVDAEAANEAYAKQLGTTSSKLTEAEKKQALLNAVVQDSTDILAANKDAGGDAASNFERMDASIQNAKVALGELFSPAVAAIAQSIADAAVSATEGMKALAETDSNLAKALTPDLLAIELLRENIDSLNASMREMADAGNTSSESYQEQAAEVDRLSNKLVAAEAALLRQRAGIDGNVSSTWALEEAGLAAATGQKILAEAAASVGRSFSGAGPYVDAFTQQLANLKAQSDATIASLNSIRSSAVGALESAASAAVGVMSSPEISRVYSENKKRIEGQIAAMEAVGMSADEIKFKSMELAKEASAPFDIAVEAAREAEKQNGRVASSVAQVSKEYSALESAVSGVLAGALDPGVGVDPQKILEGMGFPREDAINENARRLADIAVNGLKDQDWLGEFGNEVPDIWRMIRTAQNPQEEAARLLQDFQDGLLTSPIDKQKAKEIVKRQIMGDQNMAALANEIATELAAEMGIPMQQALAAAQGTIGGGTGLGSEAATQFAEGAAAGMEEGDGGGMMVTKFIDQARAKYSLLTTAGKDAGKLWGAGFIEVVGENVPPALIDILTNLVTPAVMGRMAQRGSLTGANP